MGVCNTLSTPPSVLRKAGKPSLVKHRLQTSNNDGRCSIQRPSMEDAPTTTTEEPSSQQQQTNRRCVRIGEVQIIDVDRHVMDSKDEHEKARIWWTKEEKRDIVDRNHRMTRYFILHHEAHVRVATSLFEQICWSSDSDSSSSSSSSSSSDEDDSTSMSTSNEEELVGKITSETVLDLPTRLRGLEGAIVPAMKAHRKTHVRNFLQWQETLSQSSPPPSSSSDDGTNDDRMAEQLGQFAMTSSRRSRVMARVWGELNRETTTNMDPSYGASVRRNRPRMIPTWW